MQASGWAPEVSRRVFQITKPSGLAIPWRGALASRGWPNIAQIELTWPWPAAVWRKAPSTPLATRKPPPKPAINAVIAAAAKVRFMEVSSALGLHRARANVMEAQA